MWGTLAAAVQPVTVLAFTVVLTTTLAAVALAVTVLLPAVLTQVIPWAVTCLSCECEWSVTPGVRVATRRR